MTFVQGTIVIQIVALFVILSSGCLFGGSSPEPSDNNRNNQNNLNNTNNPNNTNNGSNNQTNNVVINNINNDPGFITTGVEEIELLPGDETGEFMLAVTDGDRTQIQFVSLSDSSAQATSLIPVNGTSIRGFARTDSDVYILTNDGLTICSLDEFSCDQRTFTFDPQAMVVDPNAGVFVATIEGQRLKIYDEEGIDLELQVAVNFDSVFGKTYDGLAAFVAIPSDSGRGPRLIIGGDVECLMTNGNNLPQAKKALPFRDDEVAVITNTNLFQPRFCDEALNNNLDPSMGVPAADFDVWTDTLTEFVAVATADSLQILHFEFGVPLPIQTTVAIASASSVAIAYQPNVAGVLVAAVVRGELIFEVPLFSE